MEIISESLQGLRLGSPQTHRNLAIFPLLADDAAGPGYLLLDEALDRKLAEITEVSTGGSVPELAFENRSAEKILLVDGDELIGAKQNRIVNISILVGEGSKLVIPVSCVEAGRWAYRSRTFSSAKRALFAKARARKMAEVSYSMRSSGDRRSDQGRMWKDVEDKVMFSKAEAPSMSMSDAYEQSTSRLDDFVGAFKPEQGQRGAVIALDGKVVGLELFDSGAAFGKYLQKLVRSYAFDAIESQPAEAPVPTEAQVREFLASLGKAKAESFRSVGVGEDVRLSGDGLAGGALVADGRVVHLATHVLQ